MNAFRLLLKSSRGKQVAVAVGIAASLCTVCADAFAVSKVGGPITRAEVLSRGNFWVSKHVPYNMKGRHPDPLGLKYRTDCSGFVSMALHLTPGRFGGPGTEALPAYLNRLTHWSDLRPGDVVGTLGKGTGGTNGHVVLFTAWKVANKTFHTMEERGTAYGTVKYVRPVDFKKGTHRALPYRYKHIV